MQSEYLSWIKIMREQARPELTSQFVTSAGITGFGNVVDGDDRILIVHKRDEVRLLQTDNPLQPDKGEEKGRDDMPIIFVDHIPPIFSNRDLVRIPGKDIWFRVAEQRQTSPRAPNPLTCILRVCQNENTQPDDHNFEIRVGDRVCVSGLNKGRLCDEPPDFFDFEEVMRLFAANAPLPNHYSNWRDVLQDLSEIPGRDKYICLYWSK